MKTFKIDGDYITILQLLKVEGLISSGGEISLFLMNNQVLLNGSVVNEKRKKIYPKDFLEVNSIKYRFVWLRK